MGTNIKIRIAYRFIILCIVHITLAAAIFLSTAKAQGIQFGLKAGVNGSYIWDKQGIAFTSAPTIGLEGGAFLRVPITEKLGFQPELLFTEKGFNSTINTNSYSYTLTRRDYSIDIPLQLSIKVTKLFTLLVGPQYSYIIAKQDHYSNSTGTVDVIQQQNIQNEDIRKNMSAFVVGVDANLPLLVISARTGSDLMNNDVNITSNLPSYKNAWLELMIGFRL